METNETLSIEFNFGAAKPFFRFKNHFHSRQRQINFFSTKKGKKRENKRNCGALIEQNQLGLI